MNKKTIAIMVSSTIMLNSFQMAMAQSADNNKALATIDTILSQSDAKSADELKRTLADVQALSLQLNKILTTKEKDKFLDITNKLQGALALLSSGMSYLHLSKEDQSTWRLALATGTAVINVAVRHYNAGKNISSQQVSEIVGEATQEILKKNSDMTEAMQKAVSSLNQINLEINQSRQMAERIIDNSASVQDYVALGAAVYLVLHLIAPKLTRETDGVLKKYLNTAQSATQKTLDSTKKTTVGATGVSSATDLIGLALSLGSPEAREVVGTTLTKLNQTEINLKAEITKMDRSLKAIKAN